MKTSINLKNLTLRNLIVLMTYTALLILGIINFRYIINFILSFIDILSPFIIGFMLAFILNIPMKYFYKKLQVKNEKKKRIIASLLSILLVLLIVIVVIIVVLPQVISNVKLLIENSPEIFGQAKEWLDYLLKQFNASPEIVLKMEDFQKNIGDTIISQLSSWMPSIASGVSHFTSSIMNLFMGIIIAVYMLFSKDTLIRQVKKLAKAIFKEKTYKQLETVVSLTANTFENFLTGQLTEAVIIGVLCYIGCLILKIPYASIAAIVIGFTNIIPYFGPIIGAALSSILILLVSPVKAIVFLIFSTLLQQFESNLIYPHVVGNSVGLSALWVLFSVTVGGGLFGIPGMIFGLPIFSVLYELLREWTNRRIKIKKDQNSTL